MCLQVVFYHTELWSSLCSKKVSNKISPFKLFSVDGVFVLYPDIQQMSNQTCICFISQETHKIYRQKLEELISLQATCSSAISKQRKCLKDVRHGLTKWVLPKRKIGKINYHSWEISVIYLVRISPTLDQLTNVCHSEHIKNFNKYWTQCL